MIPLIAGAGLSLAGSLIGSAKARKAEKQNRKLLNGMLDENEESYMRDYHMNSLNSPTAKAYLKKIEDRTNGREKAIDNSVIATGATQENALARKQANNEIMSDAINNVVVNQEQQNRVAKDRYIGRKTALQGELAGMNSQESKNWMNMGGNIGSSIGSLATAYLSDGRSLISPQLNKSALNGVTQSSLDFIDGQKNSIV